MIINYVLLPKLFYKKKQFLFFIFFSILTVLIILVDEFVLEQIFYPDTRGKYFPGIAFTLLETLPIIFIIVAFKFVWDFNTKQNEINNLKSLVRENELQFLKSQINPHFLFNNLNTLYSYAIENSPNTGATILQLSSVLRYMLYDCKEDYVLLSKEIKNFKDYCSLNELRLGSRGNVSFKTDIKSDENTAIAALILMVFIENAFKHSSISQSENIEIEISIETTQKRVLTFHCKNNYLPLAKKDTEATGIGLENVKKRLKHLYPDAHNLQIVEDQKSYEVVLTMQLNSK